jgi:hypothetical protein
MVRKAVGFDRRSFIEGIGFDGRNFIEGIAPPCSFASASQDDEAALLSDDWDGIGVGGLRIGSVGT